MVKMELNIHAMLADLDAEIMRSGKVDDDRKVYGLFKAKEIILKHLKV